MNAAELTKEIGVLKKRKNAVILAHYYQRPEIQDVADFVGDSYALSIKAAKVEADMIVFAGVYFMAETAKILNPTRKVVLPDLSAGCSLADGCTVNEFKKWRGQYPDAIAVTYINCSAGVKALSDIVCTSSNALKIIQSIPTERKILFAPDRNLGKYLVKESGRELIIWNGACIVHEAFSIEKLIELIRSHPDAKIIAHPESEQDILELAHYVGSTAAMIDYVKNSAHKVFIVSTEIGILHKMRELAPDKTLIPTPSFEENACACSECAYMKLNTLEKLRNCLRDEYPEIRLDDELMTASRRSIEKMIELTEA